MSNVIQFLESMGKDAALGRMSPEEYTASVNALDVGDTARDALIKRDHVALSSTLGGRMKMMMMLVPAEDDEGEDKGKDDDKKDDEQEISLN